MKKLAIPFLALTFILGMSSSAAAIDDGTYDWYGTFSFDPHNADGSATCTAEQFGGTCPLTSNFCISGLTVATNGGVQTITGPASSPYGVNIGAITGLPITIAMQGGGQIQLTVGATGEDVTTNMSVSQVDTGGSCSGAAALVPCLDSWTSNSPGSSGSPGAVVTGELKLDDPTRPAAATSCSGGSIPYGTLEYTTEKATSEVTNESGLQTYSNPISGGLSGNNLTMSTADAILRTTVGGVELTGDTLLILTLDGQLCDASGGTCAQNCP